MSILLAPNPVPGALRAAIGQAIQQNDDLILLPGEHFTNPHSSEQIQVPATGLHIHVQSPITARSIIKRPNGGLDGDDQYGLFFIPAPPTQPEIAAAQWKRVFDRGAAKPPEPNFEYEIVVRGDILIENVDIDCNIQNQPIQQQDPNNPWEHSAMLAFSGALYGSSAALDFGQSPDGVPRRMYVAFRSVTVKSMNSENGGVADDIWISRGSFHPNIQQLTLDQIRAVTRRNPKRATIGFTELAAAVNITSCELDSLHVEDDVRWDTLPRQTPEFQKAHMNLNSIVTKKLDLGAKGFVLDLSATGITVTEEFTADQVSGTLQNSIIHKAAEPIARLDMQFLKVQWKFPVLKDPLGKPFVRGLLAITRDAEPCRAVFRNNTFSVVDPMTADILGQLIDGDPVVAINNVSGNQVLLSFEACAFDPRFASDGFRNTHIAHPATRGVWTFQRADFRGVPLERALLIPDDQADRQIFVLVF
ncbi:MAG TPA: hypothetical protein VLY04_11440 [Bryobacteraceae bacterium]|nr:hypothetical protein [Bryobacteraceae bacterium]